jgi:hypothetical protein
MAELDLIGFVQYADYSTEVMLAGAKVGVSLSKHDV